MTYIYLTDGRFNGASGSDASSPVEDAHYQTAVLPPSFGRSVPDISHKVHDFAGGGFANLASAVTGHSQEKTADPSSHLRTSCRSRPELKPYDGWRLQGQVNDFARKSSSVSSNENIWPLHRDHTANWDRPHPKLVRDGTSACRTEVYYKRSQQSAKNLMLAARGHGLNGMLISSTMPNGAQRREAVVSCLLMWHKTEKRS